MDIVDGVRKLGFRKWYEHKLIEAHAWLVVGFLALIVALALVEVRNNTTGGQQRFVLMAGFVATLAGAILSWLRYHHVLEATELAAELAVCPHCDTYGRLRVVRSTPQSDAAMASNPLLQDLPHLRVQCRHCGGEWQLEPSP
jgi:hypothetical protein